MPIRIGKQPGPMTRHALAALTVASMVMTSCAAQVPEAVVQASTTVPPPQSVAFVKAVAPIGATTPTAGDDQLLEGQSTGDQEGSRGNIAGVTSAFAPAAPVVSAAPERQPATDQTSIEPAAKAPVELSEEVRQLSGATPPYEVTVGIPVVSGDVDSAVLDRVNASIEELALRTVDSFISDVEGYFEGLTISDVEMSVLSVTAEVTFISADLLSLRIREDIRLGGGVAPFAGVATIVVDLKTGDVLSVEDLVVGSEGARRLAERVEAELVAVHYEGDAAAFEPWESSIGPDYFGLVAVGPDGFEVSFAQFEAGSDALGTPMVIVPYGDLEGVVAPLVLDAVS